MSHKHPTQSDLQPANLPYFTFVYLHLQECCMLQPGAPPVLTHILCCSWECQYLKCCTGLTHILCCSSECQHLKCSICLTYVLCCNLEHWR